MSTDGGSVWSEIDEYYADGGDLVADPNNHLTYWSGGRYYNGSTYLMSVSKTTNGGYNWQRYNLSTSLGFTYALAVDPISSNTVYAGGYPDFYKTTNGGTDWTKINISVNDTVFDIAIDPDNTNIIYVAAVGGIYKSTDSGVTWNNKGLSDATALVIDPLNTQIIYAGTRSGVYKSTSAGNSWTQMNQGLDNDTSITSLGINPNNYLFAGTGTAGMYRWNLNVGITENGAEIKNKFSIHPNPGLKFLRIHYYVPKSSQVTLTIYDALRAKIKTLCRGFYVPGQHCIDWNRLDDDSKQVSSGVYFCRFSVDEKIVVKKVVLLK